MPYLKECPKPDRNRRTVRPSPRVGRGECGPRRGALRKLVTVLGCLGVSLALAGAAGSALRVGVNDDRGKFESDPSWFFPTMASTGLSVNAITLRWDETAPSAIAD